MPRTDEGRHGTPGRSWRRSTGRFGSTTLESNPPSRGLSQYLQDRLQRNKKRRTLADFRVLNSLTWLQATEQNGVATQFHIDISLSAVSGAPRHAAAHICIVFESGTSNAALRL